MITKAQKKHIQSLQQKKYRKLYGEFVVEGNKSINDFIKNAYQIKNIFTTTSDFFDPKFPIETINNKELKSISFLKNPKDSLAIFSLKKAENIDIDDKILILDNIQDPGNLGTIIRTADWFGIRQILCSNETVDAYNPKVVQATMGSLGNVNLQYACLSDFFKKYKYPVYGTFMEGKNIFKEKFPDKMAVIIGNEGNGIRAELMQFITNKITIPKHAKASAESLNAGIATAIVIERILGL